MPTLGQEQLIVVTGASSGIGAATARELASRGYHVLAGVRSAEEAASVRAPGIEPVTLDVTEPEHIAALARRIDADADGRPLRALINNAGIEKNAPVEALPLELWREQFDVNLFGAVAMIQALLPLLRRSRGSIVNISSVGGVLALPNYGAYAASKFALEAVSDALRREVHAQGVRVVVVQPGGVRTEMADRSGGISLDLARTMTAEHRGLYGELIRSAVASQSAFLASALPAADAAAKIATVATAARPRIRYVLGRDASTVIPLARLLPARLMDAVLARSRTRRSNPEHALTDGEAPM